MKYATTIGDKTYIIEINDDSHVTINGKTIAVDFEAIGAQSLVSLLLDGKSHEAIVEEVETGWQVLLSGRLYDVQVQDERAQRLSRIGGDTAIHSGDFMLKAPMPGLVIDVPVAEGQAVKKGDVLVILESMKMQNEFKAPLDGIVQRIKVKPGQTVEQNVLMLTVVVSGSNEE